jgi:hypothetical protein
MSTVRELLAAADGRRTMRRSLIVATVFAALLFSGCGAGEQGTADEPPTTSAPVPDPSQLYETDTTVLGDASGPKLCVGGVAESLPPQCVGLPLVGWDWDAVEGEKRAMGATWGTYRVVGTLDGEAFVVQEAGPARPTGGRERDFGTPCPEPAGGWAPVDPSRASDEDFAAGAAVAQSQPGYVALWVDYAGGLTADDVARRLEEGEPVLQIMNVVVTEDVAGAEAAIRESWGGPLCVTRRQGHTEAELAAIREEALAFIQEELGLRYLWSSGGDVGLAAEVGVVVDPGGAGQAALDERYGPGMVKLFPALTPVTQ